MLFINLVDDEEDMDVASSSVSSPSSSSSINYSIPASSPSASSSISSVSKKTIFMKEGKMIKDV